MIGFAGNQAICFYGLTDYCVIEIFFLNLSDLCFKILDSKIKSISVFSVTY